MMIITLLTIVGKRIKLHLSVWQPAGKQDNPRTFRWGMCGHNVFLVSDCVIAHAKGHAPPKSSGVLLLALTVLRTRVGAASGAARS